MTASKIDAPALVLERREGMRRWCVVHEEAGLVVQFGLRGRKAAEAARERLLTLPIYWELETIDLPAHGTPDSPFAHLPARTVTRLVDGASRSLLLGEQAAVLGV